METSDSLLIEQIARGESQAFATLFGRYKKAVYGLAYQLTRSQVVAEDVSQETWIRVCRNAHAFSSHGSVAAWILTIARNLCLTELRKSKKFADLPPEKFDEIPDESDSIERQFLEGQKIELLKRALDELPERQRTVLLLQIQEERSLSELALELDLQVNAVKALLFRARENLKMRIEEFEKRGKE